jgi:hypothetical protein
MDLIWNKIEKEAFEPLFSYPVFHWYTSIAHFFVQFLLKVAHFFVQFLFKVAYPKEKV